MKPLLFFPLGLAFALVLFARADGGLYPVNSKLKLLDRVSGREFTLPANQGFSYTILEVSQSQSRLRVYDREGKELSGDFAIASDALQTARVHVISEGLKAAAEGAKGKVPGCCDVKDDPVDAPERKKAAPPPSVAKPEPVPAPVAAPPVASQKAIQPRRPAVVYGSGPAIEEGGYRPHPVTPAEYFSVTREVRQDVPSPPTRPGSLGASSRRSRTNPVTPEEVRDVLADDFNPDAPAPSEAEKSGYCDIYRRFKGRVPDAPLRQILVYLSRDPGRFSAGRAIKNHELISFADYSQPSENERYYQLDLQSGMVRKEKVSHGSGTCYWQGKQKICSGGTTSMLKHCGTSNSHTRSGFYKIESTYYSQHGRYKLWPWLGRNRNGLRMRGLTPGVNWNSESDGIVMHEAPYNQERLGVPMGRSNGCVAFAPGCLKPLVDDLQGGSLFYSYAPQCGDQMSKVLKQVHGWEKLCQ